MFGIEDRTYNELREKSMNQWLEHMGDHDDMVVRGGVKVTQDYIAELKKQINALEDKSALKDRYLKKMKLDKQGQL